MTPVNAVIGRSVSIDCAAMLLKVSRRTIYNRIRDGKLQTVRTLGGSQRVTVDSMVALGFRGPAQPSGASQTLMSPARPESESHG